MFTIAITGYSPEVTRLFANLCQAWTRFLLRLVTLMLVIGVVFGMLQPFLLSVLVTGTSYFHPFQS